MTTHGVGSYAEPILISDEEDAASVERQLDLLTDSSPSSRQDSPSHGHHTLYTPSTSNLPGKEPTLHATATVTAHKPNLSITPATPISPLSAHKRKWTDMRDSTTAPLNSSAKQRKKQRRDKQTSQRTQPASMLSTHKPPAHRHHDAMHASHPDDFSMASSVHLPYDAYYTPYQPMSNIPISPLDEYHPTDGPLWSAGDRQSLLTSPWFSAPAYTPSMQPVAKPSGYATPSPFTAAPSSPDVSTHLFAAQCEPRSDAPLVDALPTSNLSEQLRQLEALSASLRALASATPKPAAATYVTRPEQIDAQVGPSTSRTFALPTKPVVQPSENQKRLIGIPDDKFKHGSYSLNQTHLDPPPLPPPVRVVPPIPSHTLVLGQLPKKFRVHSFIKKWAKRFGNALRISLDPKAGKALIEWGSPASAEAAFMSMRLRGEGKEHIRAYRYIGTKNELLNASAKGKQKAREIEEGEIEEGEVVETKLTASATEKKKKKNKSKSSKVLLEERLTEAAQPTRAPVSAHLPAVPPPAYDSPPHLHIPPISSTVLPAAPGPDLAAIIAAATALRPAIERLSAHSSAAVPAAQAEEEMELDSDNEGVVSTTEDLRQDKVAEAGEVEDMDMGEEDIEEDCSADMEMSSPAPAMQPPPSPPLPPSTLVPPAGFAGDEDEAIASSEQSARDVRRRKIEEAIAQTKAQLTLRGFALNSRPSLISSSGSSESPEPSTPVDPPHTGGVEVTLAPIVGSDELCLSPAADVVAKTDSAAVSLDDLAASFIAESIQSVQPFTSAVPPSPPTHSPTMLASRSYAIPIVAPVPVKKSAPLQTPVASPPLPLTESQKEAKRSQYYELVSLSSLLMKKIATTKDKAEKGRLMTMIKNKTNAADQLMREITSGFAAPEPVSMPIPTSNVPTSSSVAPALVSERTSVTPTPTPSPALLVPQKRRSSPFSSTGAVQTSWWPETPREMIIVVSDDEAD